MTNNEAELDKKIWAILYHHREGGTSVTKATKEIMHLITEQTRKERSRTLNDITIWANQEMAKDHVALKPHHKAEE